MKFLTVLFISFFFFVGKVFGHDDHALGEGSIHAFDHAIFWTLFAFVIYKAYSWFNNKKIHKS